jgi:Gpi18-like mannosyltransferase
MRTFKQINLANLAIAVFGIALAIALRYSLLDFKSADYFKYTKIWYNTLKANGFAAFGQGFSNYNLPYLYCLYLIARFFPGIPGPIATKIPSLLADFISAAFTFRIVRLRHTDSPLPLFAAFAVLFSPTIILNSAFWGQADALYASALLATIYFILTRKNIIAMLCFAISVAFKAQAVFLLPFLFALFLRKEISWRHFLLIPFVLFLVIIPAWIAGRSLLDLLLIYPAQAGQYEQLSMHAPSLFSWLPDSGRVYSFFYPVGLILSAAIGFFYAVAVYRSQVKLTTALLVKLALISVLIMPFFLPKMHERYFYLADLVSIVFAFYFPSYFFVPIVMTVVSFFSYQPTLFNEEPIPIGFLAVGVLLLLIILIRKALIELYPASAEPQKAGTQ